MATPTSKPNILFIMGEPPIRMVENPRSFQMLSPPREAHPLEIDDDVADPERAWAQ